MGPDGDVVLRPQQHLRGKASPQAFPDIGSIGMRGRSYREAIRVHLVPYTASTTTAVAGFEDLRDVVQQNLIIAGVFDSRTIEPGMET